MSPSTSVTAPHVMSTAPLPEPLARLDWRRFSELTLDELYEVMTLRQEIFVIEQRCFYLDADGVDQEALHLLGRDSAGHLIGYLRAYPSEQTDLWKVGRVAVAASARREGLGALMMLRCHQRLLREGVSLISLAAQTHVESFYQSLGYQRRGEEFMDAGIPHVMMDVKLISERSTLRHLVFDFDGTLVDSAYDYALCFQELARTWTSSRPTPDTERLRALMFAGVRPQLEYTLGDLTEEAYHEALTRFREICLQIPLTHTRPYPSVRHALASLSAQGYTLSICTNRPQDLAEEALRSLGMRAWFKAVVGGDRGLERKPSPEMLEHLWSEIGIGPDESVLIGDSEVDVLAARAAGCTSVAVAWGYTARDRLDAVGADVTLDQSDQLTQLSALLS